MRGYPTEDTSISLFKPVFWFCRKVIAEPMIIGIAQVDEDRVEDGK
jgi:hypothetical protein